MTSYPRGFASFSSAFALEPTDDRQMMREHLLQLQDALNRVQEGAIMIGSVVGETGGKLIVRDGQHVIAVKPPIRLDVKRGDQVFLTKDGAIAGRVEQSAAHGQMLKVLRLDGAHGLEIEVAGGGRGYASHNRGPGIKVGDRVTLDQTGCVVTHVLGPPPTELVYADETGVSWQDIGGQAEAKRALIEAIEEPYRHPDLYKKYGKRPTRGILLHGSPGCGKTMLAKAVATSLATMHGASARAGGFIYVKGPEVLNKWVGASEAGVRAIFAAARQFQKENGYPAVVCIDEADAILARRGGQEHEGMERTIVPQFLAEMDGLDDSGAIVLLLTNRPDVLDGACVRDGRVDRRVKVGRPTEGEACEIVHSSLNGKAITSAQVAAVDAQTGLANIVAAEIWSGKYPVLMVRTPKGTKDRRIGLDAFASGAMLVGVVERATQLALRRAIDEGKDTGIGEDDIRAAVRLARAELHGCDHSGVILENCSINEDVRIEEIKP